MKITVTSFSLFALFLAAPTLAQAQCPPGSVICASAGIGVNVTIGAPPPPRQQVVVYPAPQPPRQVVVVQQAPPRPVVYVQPAPPPRQVVVQYAPPPPQVVVTTQQRPRAQRAPRNVHWGIGGSIGGMFGEDVQMGGANAGLRLRPGDSYFAADLRIGGYAGTDYNGLERSEVPVTGDLLLFVNPGRRVQFYGVAGIGVSLAHAEGISNSGDVVSRDYAYVGGQLGAGLELRLTNRFALNADIRGFIRQRVDENPVPEFIEMDDNGTPTGRTTDTSGGATLRVGATLYF